MSLLTNVRSQDESSNREFLAVLPSGDLVPLEWIVRTEELHRRPERAADYKTENRALVALARALADSPRTILQTLADTILQVFHADSAGLSLLAADGKSFYWPAIAGGWKPHVGGGTPRDFGPCGDVLDCNAPMLFTHWERRYPYLLSATPAAYEGLLVPFYVEGKAVGTIWAITHKPGREFDAEDLRQLESLTRFASAAYQAVASLDLVQQRAEALETMEEAIQSRIAMEKLNLELMESQDRYRTLFDLCPLGIYSCDAQGVILKYNRTAVELWGREPKAGDTHERFCGSSKLYHPDGTFVPHDESPMAMVVSGKIPEVRDGDVLVEMPGGKRISVVANIRPLKNLNGEVIGAINGFYDVTERNRVQEALRQAGERFRFMAESMPQKIFTAKPNGEVDYFNRQCTEFTGLSFEQIRDWGWIQFIHPDDRADNVRLWQHSIDTGVPFRFEHRFRGGDGSYRWHLSQAVPMRDAQGEITMWIGSNTDIQEVRDQEERLRRTEKMAAAGQLASSIAHEINNPLSSVMNALYLIESHEKEQDETVRGLLTTASSELARVSRIVKQSLSYHRVGTIPREFDLSGIVNESLQILGVLFQDAGVELKTRIQKGRPLLGFPDELRQVIDNLLRNAMEAMPKGGRLHVSVQESFDWTRVQNRRKGARLTIVDTGCGIPKEYRSRILDPFFTTKAEKGNGLGLWISQGIISKHEGVLSLRSCDTEGKSGTILSLFLPSVSNTAGSHAVEQGQLSERPARTVWASSGMN